jgi:hypothetical protein
MRVFQVMLAFVTVLGAAVTADALLTISDFSVVAVKWDNGETVTDTPNGVLATPQPINDGAVNLMLFNNDFPLYIDGPYAAGLVAFGLADQNAWTPVDGDGNDLDEDFAAIGDRVYVLVTQTGGVSLISKKEFTTGVVVDTTSVTLDLDKAWVLDIHPVNDWATVSYGGVVIAEGNPFDGTSNAALRTNVKTDFVISVICGGFDEDTGYATLNDVSSAPPLIFVDGFESGNTTAWSSTIP